jgi:hypothetical protein
MGPVETCQSSAMDPRIHPETSASLTAYDGNPQMSPGAEARFNRNRPSRGICEFRLRKIRHRCSRLVSTWVSLVGMPAIGRQASVTKVRFHHAFFGIAGAAGPGRRAACWNKASSSRRSRLYDDQGRRYAAFPRVGAGRSFAASGMP